jgi:iron(III) transport system ATP-binding protein
MSFLKISQLEKTYGVHKILKGIDLDIERGEFVSLLGPSGSGKTTILRCLAGLEKPDKNNGQVVVNGRVLSDGSQFVSPEKRNLGMVFQSYAVWPHMNVFENVAFPLRLRKSSGPSEITKKVEDVLGLVRMLHLKDRFAHEMSGGQQQRVALARALVMSPDILLLDEPLSNLDALLRVELGAEIRRLQKKLNLTTILVTHDQKEALSLSDRIVVLNGGLIESQGAPELLYSNPTTAFVAEFLSGAQNIRTKSGAQKQFLPRRWRLLVNPTDGSNSFRISSRIFLGNEYEYWAENSNYSEPVRFFYDQKLEITNQVHLEYV